ncbi:MAG TPA: hypothetical protein VIK55_21200 [Paludibacter sp.]
MDARIIKDIRYYEKKRIDYKGQFDGILGNVYCATDDTMYIGQRIARKLNEFGFESGEYDHLYIVFSADLDDNEICESDVHHDTRIRTFIYGLNPSAFNLLTNDEKIRKVRDITFKVLRWSCKADEFKTQTINNVATLIEIFDRSLIIKYKSKETRLFRIDLSFQIRPLDEKSKLIVEYTNKQDDIMYSDVIDLHYYEDLYVLIDRITLKDGFIHFQPKKNYLAEMTSKQYIIPLIGIEINKMKKITATNTA